MAYTEEERRATAREALDWCGENHGTLSAWSNMMGRDYKTINKWVMRYYPDERGKYSRGKTGQGHGEEGRKGFVHVQGAPEARRTITVRYLGAEIETDGEGLEAVLRTVQALSRSAR